MTLQHNFRFARRSASAGSAALVIKINKEERVMEEVEQFDNISIEELADGMSIFLNIYAGGEASSLRHRDCELDRTTRKFSLRRALLRAQS